MNKLLIAVIGLPAALACERSRAPDVSSNQPPSAVPPTVTIPQSPSAQRAPVAGAAGTAKTAARAFSFDTDQPGSPSSGFSFGRTGSGRLGRWLVQADGTALSGPNVLAQLDDDRTSNRFPVAVSSEAQQRDVRVSVRCKMISGSVDRACGLVLRYRDEKNYLITRANALEGNVRLYTVHDGDREQIASHSETIAANVWHSYRFEAKGDELRVFWNGKLVLEQRDATFMDPGKVGLWTKADSVTSFDDLQIEAL